MRPRRAVTSVAVPDNTAISRVPIRDAWIQERVDQVDDQCCQGNRKNDDEHDPVDDEKIGAGDRLVQQRADSRQAEDHFKAIALVGTLARPQVKTTLVTEEWTPLEPKVIDHKFYVRGVGTILEQTERGGDERLELRSLTKGG